MGRVCLRCLGGVRRDIQETAVAQGNDSQEWTGSGWLAPGSWPLAGQTSPQADRPCSCQAAEENVERPGSSSGSVFSSIGRTRFSRRSSSQLEPDQTVTARWQYVSEQTRSPAPSILLPPFESEKTP